jgi:hypothetical protein
MFGNRVCIDTSLNQTIDANGNTISSKIPNSSVNTASSTSYNTSSAIAAPRTAYNNTTSIASSTSNYHRPSQVTATTYDDDEDALSSLNNAQASLEYDNNNASAYNNNASSAYNNNASSAYNNASSAYNNASAYNNNASSAYNNASAYNNNASAYNNVGSAYNNVGSAYNNSSVYNRPKPVPPIIPQYTPHSSSRHQNINQANDQPVLLKCPYCGIHSELYISDINCGIVRCGAPDNPHMSQADYARINWRDNDIRGCMQPGCIKRDARGNIRWIKCSWDAQSAEEVPFPNELQLPNYESKYDVDSLGDDMDNMRINNIGYNNTGAYVSPNYEGSDAVRQMQFGTKNYDAFVKKVGKNNDTINYLRCPYVDGNCNKTTSITTGDLFGHGGITRCGAGERMQDGKKVTHDTPPNIYNAPNGYCTRPMCVRISSKNGNLKTFKCASDDKFTTSVRLNLGRTDEEYAINN